MKLLVKQCLISKNQHVSAQKDHRNPNDGVF